MRQQRESKIVFKVDWTKVPKPIRVIDKSTVLDCQHSGLTWTQVDDMAAAENTRKRLRGTFVYRDPSGTQSIGGVNQKLTSLADTIGQLLSKGVCDVFLLHTRFADPDSAMKFQIKANPLAYLRHHEEDGYYWFEPVSAPTLRPFLETPTWKDKRLTITEAARIDHGTVLEIDGAKFRCTFVRDASLEEGLVTNLDPVLFSVPCAVFQLAEEKRALALTEEPDTILDALPVDADCIHAPDTRTHENCCVSAFMDVAAAAGFLYQRGLEIKEPAKLYFSIGNIYHSKLTAWSVSKSASREKAAFAAKAVISELLRQEMSQFEVGDSKFAVALRVLMNANDATTEAALQGVIRTIAGSYPQLG